jgi:hypothetical protein
MKKASKTQLDRIFRQINFNTVNNYYKDSKWFKVNDIPTIEERKQTLTKWITEMCDDVIPGEWRMRSSAGWVVFVYGTPKNQLPYVRVSFEIVRAEDE